VSAVATTVDLLHPGRASKDDDEVLLPIRTSASLREVGRRKSRLRHTE
jgi:hypothetical protein